MINIRTQETRESFFTRPPVTYDVKSSNDDIQSKDKSPSPELLSLLNAAADAIHKQIEQAQKIRLQAQKEGLDDDTARLYVASKIPCSRSMLNALWDADYQTIVDLLVDRKDMKE